MTEKWEDTWFYGLSPKYKLLWIYILDKCDHAGLWEANFDLASRSLGTKYREDECAKAFSGKAWPVGGSKWLVGRFIFHQYGCEPSGLNPENNAHRGVIQALVRNGIDPQQPLNNPTLGALDKDKEKEKEKEKKQKEEKHAFGEFENVRLTDKERARLTERLKSDDRAKCAIEILSAYKKSKNRKYDSDYATFSSWVIRELEKREAAPTVGRNQRKNTASPLLMFGGPR